MPLIQLLEVLDRGGCSAVAGESLHSHAVIHQVDSEWRRGDRRGFVAAECFWAVSFPFHVSTLGRDERIVSDLLIAAREFKIETKQ